MDQQNPIPDKQAHPIMENAAPQQPAQPTQKKGAFPKWVMYVLIVAIGLGVGGIGIGAYYYLTKEDKEEAAPEVTTIDTSDSDTTNDTTQPADTDTTDEYEGWKTYRDDVDGFLFKYPSDWKLSVEKTDKTGNYYIEHVSVSNSDKMFTISNMNHTVTDVFDDIPNSLLEEQTSKFDIDGIDHTVFKTKDSDEYLAAYLTNGIGQPYAILATWVELENGLTKAYKIKTENIDFEDLIIKKIIDTVDFFTPPTDITQVMFDQCKIKLTYPQDLYAVENDNEFICLDLFDEQDPPATETANLPISFRVYRYDSESTTPDLKDPAAYYTNLSQFPSVTVEEKTKTIDSQETLYFVYTDEYDDVFHKVYYQSGGDYYAIVWTGTDLDTYQDTIDTIIDSIDIL